MFLDEFSQTIKVLRSIIHLFRIIKLPFTGWKRAMAELKAVLRK